MGVCGSGAGHIDERFLSEIDRAMKILGGFGEQICKRFEELKMIGVSDIARNWWSWSHARRCSGQVNTNINIYLVVSQMWGHI